MINAAIYIRVSGSEQTAETQRQPCVDYCTEHGWNIVNVFSDHAKSAYKNVKRPEYDKLLCMVKQRRIKHVVVWSLDRWTRRGPKELRYTINFLSMHDCKLHSVKEQWIESINMPGSLGETFKEFMLGIVGWLAESESQRKSERVKDSIRYKKALEKGKVGRPSLTDDVKDTIIEHLKAGKPYSYIQIHVTYQGKYGKQHHVSKATVSKVHKSLKKSQQGK
jgi:DNA invertase Pin-like site-specific DNA recombinase